MSDVSVEQLGKAISRLEESLAAYGAEPENLMYRDSVIKRFEFTFEVAQSLLRKFVTAYSVNVKDTERLTFPSLIRTASQDGVLREGYDVWQTYRDARNRSSHTYNEDQALAVMAVVPGSWKRRSFCMGGCGRRWAMPEEAVSAGLNPGLHLGERELELVRGILREHLPERAVWAFGSRATGGRMLKRFSDLDLAVEGTLTWTERAGLSEAFEESLLPIKVDVVEMGLVEAEFRERIAEDFVVVQAG